MPSSQGPAEGSGSGAAEAEITHLLKRAGTTRRVCDEKAANILEDDVTPVSVQGCSSYTVGGASTAKLVQFRTTEFDSEVLRLARSIHGGLVAETFHHGFLEDAKQLSIYVVERLPGVTYTEYSVKNSAGVDISEVEFQRQRNTITGLAKFFIRSWKSPQSIDASAQRGHLNSRLVMLSHELPSQFKPAIRRIQKALGLLFAPDYPPVFAHGDLTEKNYLVDPSSGHVTGILDWQEARAEPFGLDLWVLVDALGFVDERGHRFFARRAELERVFWETFRDGIGEDDDETWERQFKAISVAKTLAVLLRYGPRVGRVSSREGAFGPRNLAALLS